MSSTIVFAGGGSGGHVFPGLAVAEVLQSSDNKIVWIGSKNGMERDLVKTGGIQFYPIRSGKLRRYISIKNIFDVFNIVIGFFQALYILRKVDPGIVFSKGGYVSVPPAWAARILKIPLVTHESDVSPGLATRLIMNSATAVAVSYQETVQYVPQQFRQKLHVCGNPVRRRFFEADPVMGRQFLKIDDKRIIVLVLGGSLGARQLNDLTLGLLKSLPKDCVVVHQTGREKGRQKGRQKGRHLQARRTQGYISFEFIGDEYPDILASADIVLSRAGASTIWEIAALRKPAVLIPLGTSSSRGDQIQNAELFERLGVANAFYDNPTADEVAAAIVRLMEDKPLRDAMAKAYDSFQAEGAAERLAELIVKTKHSTTLDKG